MSTFNADDFDGVLLQAMLDAADADAEENYDGGVR